jgi:cell division protein FtsB
MPGHTSIRQTIVTLLCLGLTGYFGYHAIKGRHGLEARLRLEAEAKALETRLASLEAVRSNLVRDVSLLGDQHLDQDSLDEAARNVLGFAGDDEIVVRTGTPIPKPSSTTP